MFLAQLMAAAAEVDLGAAAVGVGVVNECEVAEVDGP